MRFFFTACVFGLLVGSVGCVTHNWSTPIFARGEATATDAEASESVNPREQQHGIFDLRNKPATPRRTGIDPRARQIEQRLGM